MIELRGDLVFTLELLDPAVVLFGLDLDVLEKLDLMGLGVVDSPALAPRTFTDHVHRIHTKELSQFVLVFRHGLLHSNDSVAQTRPNDCISPVEQFRRGDMEGPPEC